MELKPVQRGAVELEVRFGEGQVRPARVIGATEADVFRHQAVIPTEAHPAELQDHAPRAQFGHEPGFEEFGQADAIQVSQSSEEQEEEKQDRDAAPAKATSNSLPKTPLGDRRHIIAWCRLLP